MSINGLFNQQFPLSLDGTTSLDASSITIDGTNIDLTNLVPYTGATAPLDMNGFAVQSSHVPSGPNDLVNYTTLVSAISNQDTTNFTTFLDKITNTAQTVQASTTFLTGLSVSNERTTNLSSKVIVGANYQNLITSADVSVSQNFGAISNVGVVYQATTDTASGSPILIGFPIVSGKRYRFTIEMLVEDPTYGWYVEFLQSADNINPVTGGIIGVFLIPTGSTAYTASDHTFVALTTGSVIIQTTTDGPSGNNQAVKWKNLTVYEMGVSLENASYPSLGADRVPIINEKRQLVASGINSTKLGYLDNVSSDIQTQLNARVLKAGDTMTGTLDMGANKIITTYTPVNGEDLITKTYADATYLSSGAGYLPLTGGTLTGNLTTTTGTLVNFGEALKTVATDKGYTGASFTVSTAEVPAGVQTGTLSGTYRLTALSGYAVMAMAIADLNATYQQNEYYTFYFYGMASSVPLTLTVYQNTTPRVALNITTSPQTHSATFTTGTGSGKIYFNFQALSANPYVDWTGFTMTRTDTQVNGFLRANGSVGIGTNTPDTTLNVVGKGKFYDGNVSAPVLGVNGGAGTRLILWPGTVSTYAYALGIDSWTLWYGVPAGGSHRWYDGGTERMTLTTFLDVKGGIRSYADGPGGPAFIYAENANAGDAYAVMFLRNNNSGTGCYWFMNSTTRTADGGANTATLRNDAGRLRLQGAQAYGIQVYNNGAVGVEGASPYAITNNFMGRGSLTIGSIDQNFGGGTGGWTSTTAGLLLECLTHTEIAVHDAGQRVASLMYYLGDGTNRIYIGRDMGYGTTGTTFRGSVDIEAGDNSSTYYGPNATWGAYLLVGARQNAITSNRAQVISTNGNLHLDGAVGREMYYGYYAWNGGGQNNHRFYGNSYFQGGVYVSDWFRLQNNYNGLYWENLGRGICSPEGGGNTYGNICTFGNGLNGWAGYGLRSRYCLMSDSGGVGGIHDNTYSWIMYWPGSASRQLILGGGSTMCSLDWDLFVVWRSGASFDWANGYFYFNRGGGYGYSSDSRLKDNIQPIQANESITFLKHLQPSSFCMKKAKPYEKKNADGTTETVHPECCTCEQDGFIADNVWEAVVASGASKSVLNNWSGWLEEMKKPEEERTLTKDNILGVNDRPILSHTVNAVKALMERVEVLQKREEVWVQHAKEQEDKVKRLEANIEKLASLVAQLIQK